MLPLTTLQLARAIADAALTAAGFDYSLYRVRVPDTEDAPTQAVLAVLFEQECWFCRLPGNRLNDMQVMEAAGPRQGELF